MSDLSTSALIAVRECMGARPGETVLVIMDEGTRTVGTALFVAARSLGCEAMVLEMIPRQRNGEEPPAAIADIMKRVDVVLAPTSKSLSHTKARHDACDAGARVATLPGITEDCMARTLSADYSKVGQKSRKYAAILTEGEVARITTPAGTDITMSIRGREGRPDTGIYRNRGEFGNLPAGEAYIAPVEGTANGVIVVDGAMAGIGITENPITLEVRDGLVTRILGGPAARQLEDLIAPLGAPARNIAELGIGTNDRARLTGRVLEDEKVMGTIHLAIGDNSHFGGKVAVPSHLDGIILSPTLVIDGKSVMVNGELVS
jgi:leucyl aminopeptidase (aminopeptidase T)